MCTYIHQNTQFAKIPVIKTAYLFHDISDINTLTAAPGRLNRNFPKKYLFLLWCTDLSKTYIKYLF